MYYLGQWPYGTVSFYRSYPDPYYPYTQDVEDLKLKIAELLMKGEEVRNKVYEWESNVNMGLTRNQISPLISGMKYDHLEMFKNVLTLLQQSMYALEVQCSFATQMKLEEETKKLPGLLELHKHNYETSYHRTTANGCLHRILSGERHPFVFGIMIHCMIKSEEHDEAQVIEIQKMKQHAKGSALGWVQTVQQWHSLQMSYLKQAMSITRSLVGEQMWKYAQGLEY